MNPKLPHHDLRPYLKLRLEHLRESASKNIHGGSNSPIDKYIELINYWKNNLTEEQLSRYYTLDEIIQLAKLEGIYKKRASNQFTGEALRRAGFIAKRKWTNAGRGKRYWKYKGHK